MNTFHDAIINVTDNVVNYRTHSEATRKILEYWGTASAGVISSRDAVKIYRQTNPQATGRSSSFVVYRLLATCGVRLRKGVYQLVTEQHRKLNVQPLYRQTAQGKLVKND